MEYIKIQEREGLWPAAIVGCDGDGRAQVSVASADRGRQERRIRSSSSGGGGGGSSISSTSRAVPPSNCGGLGVEGRRTAAAVVVVLALVDEGEGKGNPDEVPPPSWRVAGWMGFHVRCPLSAVRCDGVAGNVRREEQGRASRHYRHASGGRAGQGRCDETAATPGGGHIGQVPGRRRGEWGTLKRAQRTLCLNLAGQQGRGPAGQGQDRAGANSSVRPILRALIPQYRVISP